MWPEELGEPSILDMYWEIELEAPIAVLDELVIGLPAGIVRTAF